jgi:hypothetical protein
MSLPHVINVVTDLKLVAASLLAGTCQLTPPSWPAPRSRKPLRDVFLLAGECLVLNCRGLAQGVRVKGHRVVRAQAPVPRRFWGARTLDHFGLQLHQDTQILYLDDTA